MLDPFSDVYEFFYLEILLIATSLMVPRKSYSSS